MHNSPESILILIHVIVSGLDGIGDHLAHQFPFKVPLGHGAFCIVHDESVGRVEFLHLKIIDGVLSELLAFLGIIEMEHGLPLRSIIGHRGIGIVVIPSVTGESQFRHGHQRNYIVVVQEIPDVVVAGIAGVIGHFHALRRLEEICIQIFIAHGEAR